MKQSLLKLCIVAMCAFVTGAWSSMIETVTVAYSRCRAVVVKAVRFGRELAAQCIGHASPRTSPLLVRSRAFFLRLAKRERPQVTPGWRMCPST